MRVKPSSTLVRVPPAPRGVSPEWFSDRALGLRQLSIERWGEAQAVDMVGRSPSFLDLLAKIEKVSRYREPVLVTGESGVGKEGIGQAIYLFGDAPGSPFVSVNCPQFQEDNLTVSELFGHVKGSFTGAVGDRRGAFEEADGGALFLDEIGDLLPAAQAMLLRVLATGELRPLGATRTRSVNVRVIAATNKPLNQLAMSREFRYDLLFRLRHFHLQVPPLRDRGDDWRLVLDYCLHRLSLKYGVRKQFSAGALRILEQYAWPGNVRQVVGVVNMGYAMADADTIEVDDFSSLLERSEPPSDAEVPLLDRVVKFGEDFWTAVYKGFMDRDLNREQVRTMIRQGLVAAGGNYRRLLDLLRLPASDYQRFMLFLRHHDLKPRSGSDSPAAANGNDLID
jgi:transcriptional regulator with GAF, ATPase, and Fis domain